MYSICREHRRYFPYRIRVVPGSALFARPTIVIGGCSTGRGGQSRPGLARGCAGFDQIAVTIEADGRDADVTFALHQIEQGARVGGATAVEVACRGQR